ncbi:MAG: L-threonylcarbamoyladenylate synthase, partial [Limnohabitans sp.]
MILDGQSPQVIAAAAQALQRGDLLGLPTETVYGLAADAGSDVAVAKIFAAKGRP